MSSIDTQRHIYRSNSIASSLYSRAYTLIEVLVVVSILGIVTTVAVSNIRQLVVENEVRRVTADLYNLIWSARYTSIRVSDSTFVCPHSAGSADATKCKGGGWNTGVSLLVSELENNGALALVKAMDPVGYGVKIKTDVDTLQFRKNGFTALADGGGAGSTVSFIICHPNTPGHWAKIDVAKVGHFQEIHYYDGSSEACS